MRRIPGWLLGLAFGTLLVAHAGALLTHGSLDGAEGAWLRNAGWLAGTIPVLLLGRLVLAFLPPGLPGAHDPRRLPETWAASLALGTLAVAWVWSPGVRGLEALLGGSPAAGWLPTTLGLVGLALVAALRWITLPGAMVPRHAQERSGGRERWLLAAALAGWLVLGLGRADFPSRVEWLALALLLEGALARARRAPLGRTLFVLAFALLPAPGLVVAAPGPGLHGSLGASLCLGAGGAFLVPWLRRADRRAGVLAALFFGASFLRGADPLALAGPLVLVVASPRPRRAFAAGVTLASALAGVAVGRMGLEPLPPRERFLLGDELLRGASDLGAWGLAWPMLLCALVAGALGFPWRRPAWSPGRIEVPRREALALAALLGIAIACVAPAASPWGEEEALVVLFPLAALLAGLLLLPPEGP